MKRAAIAAGAASIRQSMKGHPMTDHLIAVETYGSQRITYQGRTISAQKLGYTGCGRDVLLTLYGEAARDVTSKRASYHYVQIDGQTTVHSGTLLLYLTNDQLTQVEAVTRQHRVIRSGVWRWFDNPGRTNHGWHAFPTQDQPDYQPPRFREGPRYNPTGYRAATPGQTVAMSVATAEAIHVERTQLRDDKPPWWWITGNTYPHRAAFKAAGCRWSRKRKAWYTIGETLPEAITQLIERVNDASAVDGPTSEPTPEVVPTVGTNAGGQYKVGDRVQAVADFAALGGGTIKEDTPGTITQCFGAAGELGHSYNVDFETLGETWCFEMDLKSAPDSPPPPVATPAVTTPEEPTPAPITQAVPPVAEPPAEPEGVPGVHYPRFTVGQTVYTSATLKLDETGTAIAQGQVGTVLHRFDIRQTDKYESFGYTVQFQEALGGKHQHALFERTLDAEPPRMNDLRVRRDEPIMLVPGAGGQSLLATHIARREAIVNGTDWDGGTTADPITDELPDTVQPADETSTESEPTITPDDKPITDEAEAEPAIRVLKPEALPDHLQTAVEAARGKSVTVSAPSSNATRTPIGQAYVGELTGAITGNVYCYGYAVYQDTLLYLNMGGPSTAVAAIRAKLAKGEAVNLVPWDAPAIELSAGETDGVANTGMFTAFVHNISEARFTSAVLVHAWLTDPLYGGKSTTGIFRTSEAQAVAKLIDHVRKLVKVPVFEAWAGFLYEVGGAAGLVRPARSGGEIDLLAVDLDADAWTRLITGGLANGVIRLPRS